MEIIIKIENKNTQVTLRDGERVVDEFEFQRERELSAKLLPAIDEMLARNVFSVSDISKIKVETDESDSFTTTRIAKTIANVFNWAKKNKTIR